MFDPDSEVPYAQIPFHVNNSKEHNELALEAAQKSIILLKNENQTLPLTKDIDKVALATNQSSYYKVLFYNIPEEYEVSFNELSTGDIDDSKPGIKPLYDLIKSTKYVSYIPPSPSNTTVENYKVTINDELPIEATAKQHQHIKCQLVVNDVTIDSYFINHF